MVAFEHLQSDGHYAKQDCPVQWGSPCAKCFIYVLSYCFALPYGVPVIIPILQITKVGFREIK